MCGLFTLRARHATLFDHTFQIADAPRYKVYPGQPVPALRLDDGEPAVSRMKWGFRPSWAPAKRTCINIRAETAASSPMFRQAFRGARCLIPADGFFEPNRSVPGKQYVWFHRPDDGVFWFPALWTTFAGGDSEPEDTCGLITTAPNATVEPFHGRMPVVLASAGAEAWLTMPADSAEPPSHVLSPTDDRTLIARHVTPKLYRLDAGDPAAIHPAS
jgi:putative SOS response-associated peptidase YedK